MNAPAIANLNELRQGVGQPREASLPQVRAGFGDLQGFELAQRAAKALAASSLVPQQFQGNMPNCLIALEMANRIGASPLMVMQNLYIVHGRPGWSAKFLIATFNQCGRFSAIRYRWQGEEGQKRWGCQAYAVEKATGEEISSAWITWKLVESEGWNKKNGSKWQTMPEQMFMYRSAAWLVNTHAPEISMGLNTAEEIGDVYEAERDAAGGYVVTQESLRRVEDETTAPAIEPEAPPADEPPPAQEAVQGVANPGAVTFAKVADALNKAKEVDMLDAAADLIGLVEDAEQQDELRAMYNAKREGLVNG